jgi:peptidoglycan-associated lipoprotein
MKTTIYTLLIPLCAGLAAAGCAHEEKKVASAAPAARSAPPPERRAAPVATAQPEAPPSDDSKGDKDLAIYFDFDSSTLRDDARPVLQKVAQEAQARDHRSSKLRIEGNCDEVGTTEYNMALGEHRALQAKEYLVHMGIPSSRITTVSYGAERPRAEGHDESARAQNRRDDLLFK